MNEIFITLGGWSENPIFPNKAASEEELNRITQGYIGNQSFSNSNKYITSYIVN